MPLLQAARRRLRFVPPLLLVLAMVHPIARSLARWDWRLDLISHFQEPALVATLLAAAALRRRRRIAVALLLLAAFQVEPLLRYRLSSGPQPRPDGPRLRIMMANVFV